MPAKYRLLAPFLVAILGFLAVLAFLMRAPRPATPTAPTEHKTNQLSPVLQVTTPENPTLPIEAETEPQGVEPKFRLVVRVVDDQTNAPVPEVYLGLFGSFHSGLGTRITNTQGKASFSLYPEKEYRIRSKRHPPYASCEIKFTTLSLDGNEAELRLTRGVELTGRIVDDTGAPVSEATVSADLDAFFEREELLGFPMTCTTDGSGSFKITTLPDQQDCDESSYDLAIEASHGIRRSRVETKISDTLLTQSIPDIILPRSAQLSGQVIDENGSPVPGILVTGSYRRHRDSPKTSPGSIPLPLYSPEEEQTNSNGEFELEFEAGRRMILVYSHNPPPLRFDLPLFTQGEHRTGVILRLTRTCRFPLQLTVPEATRQAISSLSVSGELQNGSLIRGNIHGTWPSDLEIRFSCDDRSIVAFHLDHSVYEPISHRPPAPMPSGTPIRLTLEKKSKHPVRLRIRARTEDGRDVFTHADQLLQSVHAAACLAPFPANASGCRCGLGAVRTYGQFDGSPFLDIDIEVSAKEPYWIQLRLQGLDKSRTVLIAGPISPGPDRHDIDATLSPPPPSQPIQSDQSSQGVCWITVRDRKTGMNIPEDRMVRFAFHSRSGTTSHPDSTESPAGSHLIFPQVGRFSVIVRANGYAPFTLEDVEIPSDREIELGTVDLRPLPEFKATITDSHNRDLPPGCIIQLGHESGPAGYRNQGTIWEWPISPEGPFRLWVKSGGTQILRVEKWIPGSIPTIRLSPWSTVEIRIAGLEPQHRNTAIELEILKIEPDNPPLPCGRPWSIPIGDDLTRKFQARLGSGHYVVQGRSALYTIEESFLDIGGPGGRIKTDMIARRR